MSVAANEVKYEISITIKQKVEPFTCKWKSDGGNDSIIKNAVNWHEKPHKSIQDDVRDNLDSFITERKQDPAAITNYGDKDSLYREFCDRYGYSIRDEEKPHKFTTIFRDDHKYMIQATLLAADFKIYADFKPYEFKGYSFEWYQLNYYSEMESLDRIAGDYEREKAVRKMHRFLHKIAAVIKVFTDKFGLPSSGNKTVMLMAATMLADPTRAYNSGSNPSITTKNCIVLFSKITEKNPRKRAIQSTESTEKSNKSNKRTKLDNTWEILPLVVEDHAEGIRQPVFIDNQPRTDTRVPFAWEFSCPLSPGSAQIADLVTTNDNREQNHEVSFSQEVLNELADLSDSDSHVLCSDEFDEFELFGNDEILNETCFEIIV